MKLESLNERGASTLSSRHVYGRCLCGAVELEIDFPAFGPGTITPRQAGTKSRRKPRERWLALKPGAHEGYLDWERAEAIRRMVSENIQTIRHHGAPKQRGSPLSSRPRWQDARDIVLRAGGMAMP